MAAKSAARKIHFWGRLYKGPDGKPAMEVYQREEMVQRAFEALGYGEFQMTLREFDTQTQSPAMGYYYASLLDDITAGMQALGNDWDRNECDRRLKAMFAPMNAVKGEPSMSGATPRQWREYVGKCTVFAVQMLDVQPRPPIKKGGYFPQSEH